MMELKLPHKEPLKFAKYIISKEDDTYTVRIQFDNIPTLAMLVEAAAQSSAAFAEGEDKMGFLVTLKNIKLLEKPASLEYNVEVTSGQQVDSLTYFTFKIYDEDTCIAEGIFIISLQ